MPSPSSSSSSSPETPQPPQSHAPPTITTTTCDTTATVTTSSSFASHSPSSSFLASSFSSFQQPSHPTPFRLRKTQSTSSLLSLASSSASRRNSISSSLSSSEEDSDSDNSSSDDDENDNEKKKHGSPPQQHRSMPLLSQRTVHQLVPGSVAAQCDYPLASAKRNMEFHTLFRSVPELDPLIEVYKCALQKEILLQGHIYITEHHLCFNANIFGWVTNLVIAFSDITSIEKRMTAMIIPNGIQVSTGHAKHIFASFMSRDMAFDQMYKVWQMHHDTAQVQTSLQPQNHSDFVLKNEEDDEEEDEDEDAFSESSSVTDDHTFSSEKESDEAIVKTPHCQCDEHLNQIALDATYKGTVGVMHELLFQTNFFPKALKKYEGCQDLTVNKWDGHTRESYYKRQLSNDEGVHIRCFRKDELVAIKIPHYCAVESTVRAPDTPMGAAICLRIRTCMSRVTSTKVRVYITFQIESSQSSPIKSRCFQKPS
ncbi:GRAM domain-containing protein [Phascolomyces articulosus]|uniref:GRAM domain-containing protein n=1 Tax=Phascolomyces articulosus TaxID=60185 RepID=A0AAD5K3C6_9FUNG|nr:GRAM domain-containing protein [Phascolomyces articulosus]